MVASTVRRMETVCERGSSEEWEVPEKSIAGLMEPQMMLTGNAVPGSGGSVGGFRFWILASERGNVRKVKGMDHCDPGQRRASPPSVVPERVKESPGGLQNGEDKALRDQFSKHHFWDSSPRFH